MKGKNTEETQSVRINKNTAKDSKIFAVKKGGSIKTVMEFGAAWVMTRGREEYENYIAILSKQLKKSKT